MFQARWYQTEAEQSIHNYFAKHSGNPVIALPTGTGKSVVIGNFIKNVLTQWPNQRMMMLTHVKELIEQNGEKLVQMWPQAPMGFYSAGLNSRDMMLPIIFGGVQSVAPAIKRSMESELHLPPHMRHFGWRDLVIVDECHLISENDETYYQYVINELKQINPNLKVIGLSATPYRMKSGPITENGIFTDICYDLTDYKSFNRLVAEGFLAPLVGKPTMTDIDLSEVNIRGGEFVQKDLEKVVDSDEVVLSAVRETMYYGKDRKAWLIFATGIENTEHVANVYQSFGLDILPVHSKRTNAQNDEVIRAFKAGEILGIVNGKKLTTGFDHPPIDLISDKNPTNSPGLHVQKMGRGTRPAPGKTNCLYLDFGKNVARLGPINDPVVPGKKGKGKGSGEAPVKICPNCGVYNHTSVRHCEMCQYEFEFNSNLEVTADSAAPMRIDEPKDIRTYEVSHVTNTIHRKKGSKPSIKVTYFLKDTVNTVSEYVMLEHSGFAKQKSVNWWKKRSDIEPPVTTADAMVLFPYLKVPKSVDIWVNAKYPEIVATNMGANDENNAR